MKEANFQFEPFDVDNLSEVIIFDGPGDLIEFYRKGKYIYLEKPSEKSKRYYRFNLQTAEFERINIYKTVDNKVTTVPVKNITGWFKDCRLVTKDVHFGRLVVFAKYNRRFDKYSSPVRFIEQLGSTIITNIEKWEALGMKVYETEEFFSDHLVSDSYWGKFDHRKSVYFGQVPRDYRHYYSGYLSYAPGDFNKNVLDHIMRNFDMVDDYTLRRIHNNYNNGESKVEKEIEAVCEDPEFYDALNYVSDSYRSRGVSRNLLDASDDSFSMKIELIHTIQEYHLDIKAVLRFIKRQRNVENNDLNYLIGSRHYRDYLRCEKELKDGSFSKMNKYPSNFRTTFHNVDVEYSAKKASIDRKKFFAQSQKYKHLEHKGKKYCIIVPEDPFQIDEEANALEHCVRTYIPRVVKGETLIAFLRLNAAPQQPYVTLEIKNGVLTQAYGKNDSKPDEDALKFLKMYIGKKGIRPGCWRNNLY